MVHGLEKVHTFLGNFWLHHWNCECFPCSIVYKKMLKEINNNLDYAQKTQVQKTLQQTRKT
jgi:hypothetical protein